MMESAAMFSHVDSADPVPSSSGRARRAEWRAKFVALAEDVFRELGHPPPATNFEPGLPLAMNLTLGGMAFEIAYLRSEREDIFLVECRFGKLPEADAPRVLTRLLELNLALARLHDATFGLEANTNEVIYTFTEQLQIANASKLLESMMWVAEQGKQWRNGYFLDGDLGSIAISGRA